MTKNVKETTKYDNKLDILNTSTENPPDLIDFLDIELDSDDNTYRHWVGMPEFIQEKNPWALRDMGERLMEAHQRKLWKNVDTNLLDELRAIIHQSERIIEGLNQN